MKRLLRTKRLLCAQFTCSLALGILLPTHLSCSPASVISLAARHSTAGQVDRCVLGPELRKK